jgi:hypothetical protein
MLIIDKCYVKNVTGVNLGNKYNTARALRPDSEKMREKRIEREGKRYGQS